MAKCKQCFVMSDDSIKLCYDCLEAKSENLEADIKIKQSVCETIEKELTEINEKLKAENKKLRAIKCPPISEGDSCICPIEELEERIEVLEAGLTSIRKSTEIMEARRFAEQALKHRS